MKIDETHGTEPVSGWVARWTHLVKPQGSVLDVAGGRGRHAKWFYEQNHAVALIDRSREAIDSIAISDRNFEKVVADIENDPWPFTGRQFDALIVTHYLWRPLMPTLLASLSPGGVLIYETFTDGNETVGKPSRPDFLLRTAELLQICSSLRIVAFEDGFEAAVTGHGPRFVQRIAAVREPAQGAGSVGMQASMRNAPARYPLL